MISKCFVVEMFSCVFCLSQIKGGWERDMKIMRTIREAFISKKMEGEGVRGDTFMAIF